METTRTTWRSVRSGAIKELRERLKGDDWTDEPHDIVHEVADSHVPVYSSELAEVLADEPGIGCRELELPTGETGFWQTIQIAIYEELSEELWEEHRRLSDEREEAEED